MGTLQRSFVILCALITGAIIGSGGAAHAQDRRPAAAGVNVPLTPDGQPDIQGNYGDVGFGSGVAIAKEDRLAEVCPAGGCYERNWYEEPSKGRLQAKLPLGVIDPADGRLPLTPWGTAIKEEYKANQENPSKLTHVDTQARCLHTGVPRSNWALPYGGYQIIQGPGYVAIYTEYNHIFRFIPIDGRGHASPNLRLFGGDSVGRWEGRTLIIETTNIGVPPATGFGLLDMQGSPFSDAMRVVERYTIVDHDTLAVEITIDDPKAYTKPWKIAGAFVRGSKAYQLFEYACHEGNYALETMAHGFSKAK
jgi:hypothetical protein